MDDIITQDDMPLPNPQHADNVDDETNHVSELQIFLDASDMSTPLRNHCMFHVANEMCPDTNDVLTHSPSTFEFANQVGTVS
mmetsp:Transcript_26824/g.37725  ORF Transcript_26824/g.37725 Transcript_26824/m.37725 type:complete len:82 (-) Transcript_26824:1205-1450(-)